jgi:hypothetical protein
VSYPHHAWLKKTGDDLQADYERIREIARLPAGIQQSGHEAEAGWKQLLEDWLPPNYEIGVRKYLLYETPVDGVWQSRETDLVVFHPAYPEALRKRNQIIISGVVAAFSVKLTLDRAGIAEAIRDAAVLRRGIKVEEGKKVGELLSPLVFGVLAHSQKNFGNDPDQAIDLLLLESSAEVIAPRQSLDLVCVADLNCWRRHVVVDIPYPPGHPFHRPDPSEQPMYLQSFVSMGLGPRLTYPVAALIGGLWGLFAQRDPSLKTITRGLWEPLGVVGVNNSRPLASVTEVGGRLYRSLVSEPGPTIF